MADTGYTLEQRGAIERAKNSYFPHIVAAGADLCEPCAVGHGIPVGSGSPSARAAAIAETAKTLGVHPSALVAGRDGLCHTCRADA